jgi:hypothetical protein
MVEILHFEVDKVEFWAVWLSGRYGSPSTPKEGFFLVRKRKNLTKGCVHGYANLESWQSPPQAEEWRANRGSLGVPPNVMRPVCWERLFSSHFGAWPLARV